MEDCGSRYGSVIGEVSGTGIESLISAEKLRGTDLYLGPTGASKSGNRSGFGRKIVIPVQVEVSDGQEFPVEPHAVHGWI